MTEQLSLIVNNAAANIGVQVSAESLPLIILGTYLEVELLDHKVVLFSFLWNFHTDFYSDTAENSERDGNTRPPDLPLEKPVCNS